MKHNQPLYLSGYLADVKVQQIQVDPGSAVNVMPLHSCPPRHSAQEIHTKTLIQGYNAKAQKALGKIRLVEKLKTEVTCYVIDNESLLLGRPWIHDNRIVPSTLHQCLKYVNL